MSAKRGGLPGFLEQVILANEAPSSSPGNIYIEYLRRAQPIHLIAPFSLSNISMIILALTITLNHEEVRDAYGVIEPTLRSKS